MFTPRDILLGAALPAVVTAAVLVIARLVTRRSLQFFVPLALGAGFSVGYSALFRPPLLPIDPVDWLCPLAVLIAIVGAYFDLARLRLPWRGVIVGVLALGTTWLIGRPLLESKWESGGVLWISGITLTMLVSWLAMEQLAKRVRDLSVAIALAVVTAASALTISMSGSKSLGQIGGLLTAVIFGFLAASVVVRPRIELTRSAMLVIVLLFVAIVAFSSTYAYAEVTSLNAILLLIAPVMAWTGELLPTGLRPLARGTVRAVSVAIPAGVAVALAAVELQRAMREAGELGW